MQELVASLLFCATAVAAAILHVKAVRDPDGTSINRWLWRLHSAKWLSPFAPATRMWLAIVNLTVMAVLAAVLSMLQFVESRR